MGVAGRLHGGWRVISETFVSKLERRSSDEGGIVAVGYATTHGGFPVTLSLGFCLTEGAHGSSCIKVPQTAGMGSADCSGGADGSAIPFWLENGFRSSFWECFGKEKGFGVVRTAIYGMAPKYEPAECEIRPQTLEICPFSYSNGFPNKVNQQVCDVCTTPKPFLLPTFWGSLFEDLPCCPPRTLERRVVSMMLLSSCLRL